MEITGETTSGVASELNGRYWGCQYDDGHSSFKGFGGIDNAEICDHEFCTKPEHMTYARDRQIDELRKATLVRISKTTHFKIDKL